MTLQTFGCDGSLADLAREDLGPHVVLSGQSQLHLVQNEVYLFFAFQRAVSLNGDLLDNSCSVVNLTISFVHLDLHASSVGIFSLKIHLALSGSSECFQHVESFILGWEFIKEFVQADGHHVLNGSLTLSSSLDKLIHPLSQVHIILLFECSFDLKL